MTLVDLMDPTSKSVTKRKQSDADERIKFERTLITPHIAAAWLEKNTGNRTMRRNVVDKYARDMVSGNFDFAGDVIRFDWNGRLIDGQHRLAACIKADVSFESMVVYGLDPAVQVRIDGGKARTAADALTIEGGYSSLGLLASTARLILAERFELDVLKCAWSSSEIMDVIKKHKQLPASVNAVARKKVPKGMPLAYLALIHYVGTRFLDKPEKADAFVGVMQTGESTYSGDPAHKYRERIINDGSGEKSMKREVRYWMMKHAWNLFAADETVQVLRVGGPVHITGLNRKKL